MPRNTFLATRRAFRIWLRGDWSRPVDPTTLALGSACAPIGAPVGVYWEGYTAQQRLADARRLSTPR